MRKNKILIIGLVLIMVLAATVTAFAFTGGRPVEILAGLTGKNTDDLAQARYESGKTYGQLAYEESEEVWEEFRDEMLENRKAIFKERVAEGYLTQEEADEILENIKEMQDFCLDNGGGYGMMRNRSANGFGFGMGRGFGNGNGMGFGGGRCGRGSW